MQPSLCILYLLPMMIIYSSIILCLLQLSVIWLLPYYDCKVLQDYSIRGFAIWLQFFNVCLSNSKFSCTAIWNTTLPTYYCSNNEINTRNVWCAVLILLLSYCIALQFYYWCGSVTMDIFCLFQAEIAEYCIKKYEKENAK